MKRVVLVAVLALGVGTAEARAATITGEQTEPFQTWADQSLTPTVEGEVPVAFDAGFGPPYVILRPALYRTIHWTYRGSGEDEQIGRPTFLHELGHVFDYDGLGSRSRGRFARIIQPRLARKLTGQRGRMHFYDWRLSFAEKFAMGYSFCALGITDPPSPTWYGFNYDPTASQQARVCALIASAYQ